LTPNIQTRRFDSAGNPIGGEFQVSSNGATPALAQAANSRFVVAWTTYADGSGSGIAARVFDELEATLAGCVAIEQARPFVQWRREWLGAGSPSLTRSPLASLPEQAFVLGYFPIEPDGSFAGPSLPAPNESAAVDARCSSWHART
jgi:hypothetical protein